MKLKQIKRPGIFTMSAEEYHADPAPTPSLSSTVAKVIVTQSPAHARYSHPRTNPAYVPAESEAFDNGTAIHDALLEGIDRVEVIQADNWRTVAAREQRDVARAKNRIPILAKNYDRIAVAVQFASAAFAECEDLSGLTLADGEAERSVFAEDIGCWTRCRPDWMTKQRDVIVDVKSCSGSAHPTAFARHIINMGYHIQAAFYKRCVRAVTGKDPHFVFLAIELDPPHACSFHALAPSLQALADEQVLHAIRTWAECLRLGQWPGYSKRIHYAEAPGYAAMQWEEQSYLRVDEKQLIEGLQP